MAFFLSAGSKDAPPPAKSVAPQQAVAPVPETEAAPGAVVPTAEPAPVAVAQSPAPAQAGAPSSLRGSAEEPLPASVTANASGAPVVPLVNAFTPQPAATPLPTNVEELQRQIMLLQGQIEYLQGQNDALKDENAEMLQKLGTLGMKNGDIAQANAAMKSKEKDDGVAPDFVGMGLEMMKMRKLQALPMVTSPVSQAEVEMLILRWLKRQQPEEEAQKTARGFAALGWIPKVLDPQPLKAALLARVLGGWYDDESETMYTVDPDTASDPTVISNEPLAIAYGQLLREYGSTLFQPQYGPLSTDMRIARESLISGDAGLTRFLHSLQHPASAPKDDLPSEDPDHPYNQVPLPAFLKQVILFPFSRGFEFAQTLHSAGSFAQLNAAYSRPPINTAEVIDPEMYLDPERPQPVEISLKDVKLNGVLPFLDDRMGKFICVTALRMYNPDVQAAEGARGLVADRLLAWPADGGAKRDHAAWQTLFMDKAAADAFHKAMLNWLKERYKTKGEAEFTIDGRFVSLLRNRGDSGVLLIDAASDEARAAAKLLMQQ